MQLNEHVVRQFAHQIWESEGKPEGQAERHWEMACKLAQGETGPADPLEPLSTPANGKKAKTTKTRSTAKKDNQLAAGPFGPAEHEVTMADAEPTIAPPPARVRVKAVIDDPAAAPKKRATKTPKPH
ncbi:MAG TPA: DUF2934 domain-containing protein [Cellvibrio sp.]